MSGARSGVVYLVGAGPGDPGLMTVRSHELLATADVVLHDRLIPAGSLEAAREDAELVYVGKQPGEAAMEQAEIERLMIDRARQGASVVRLKGGDPFVFGRGGEEAEALVAAEVPFEVVPGVTSGVAAPAYAGIPVTHRDDSSAVAFVTGHEDPDKAESAIDWEALARFPGTLVIYMGMKRLEAIVAELVKAGRDPTEPAAVIERGTYPSQRTVAAPLSELPWSVLETGIGPPAIAVVGRVAARREAIAWLERRPLYGRRVVVTRARAQASGLAATLAALGADVVELPAIRIEPRISSREVAAAIDSLREYALVCVTSPNGVRLLFEAMTERGLDARALAGAAMAAIGPGTTAALRERGVIADVVPERSIAESLVEALGSVDVAGRRALVARASEAREVIPDALRDRGADVDVVALYETVREDPDLAAVARARDADYVTFTSSSTVTNLLDAVGDEFPGEARVVSIGPVTSATAREAGLTVHVEAERHDPAGVIDALVEDARNSG